MAEAVQVWSKESSNSWGGFNWIRASLQVHQRVHGLHQSNHTTFQRYATVARRRPQRPSPWGAIYLYKYHKHCSRGSFNHRYAINY